MTEYVAEIRGKEHLISSEILNILTPQEKDELGIALGRIPIVNIAELERIKERYKLIYGGRGGRRSKIIDHEGNQLYRREI